MTNDFNNPFAPPSAVLRDRQESNHVNDFLGEPHNVPAGNCIKWIKGGWKLFREQPGMWVLAVFLFFILTLIISIIPIVGALIMPVFGAGFMFACHKQYETGRFDIANIFYGFQKNLPQLLILGIFPLALGIIMLITAGSSLSYQQTSTEMINAIKHGHHVNFLQFFHGFGTAGIVVFILSALYGVAMYLAPALVIINNMSAIDALKQSLKAFGKNFLGAILLILIVAGAEIAFFIVIGIIFLMIFSISKVLGLLILIPFAVMLIFCLATMTISIKYTTYRDIFYKQV